MTKNTPAINEADLRLQRLAIDRIASLLAIFPKTERAEVTFAVGDTEDCRAAVETLRALGASYSRRLHRDSDRPYGHVLANRVVESAKLQAQGIQFVAQWDRPATPEELAEAQAGVHAGQGE